MISLRAVQCFTLLFLVFILNENCYGVIINDEQKLSNDNDDKHAEIEVPIGDTDKTEGETLLKNLVSELKFKSVAFLESPAEDPENKYISQPLEEYGKDNDDNKALLHNRNRLKRQVKGYSPMYPQVPSYPNYSSYNPSYPGQNNGQQGYNSAFGIQNGNSSPHLVNNDFYRATPSSNNYPAKNSYQGYPSNPDPKPQVLSRPMNNSYPNHANYNPSQRPPTHNPFNNYSNTNYLSHSSIQRSYTNNNTHPHYPPYDPSKSPQYSQSHNNSYSNNPSSYPNHRTGYGPYANPSHNTSYSNGYPLYNPSQRPPASPSYNNSYPNYPSSYPNQKPPPDSHVSPYHPQYNNSRPNIYPSYNPSQRPPLNPSFNNNSYPSNPLLNPSQNPSQNSPYPNSYSSYSPSQNHNSYPSHPSYPSPSQNNSYSNYYPFYTPGQTPPMYNHSYNNSDSGYSPYTQNKDSYSPQQPSYPSSSNSGPYNSNNGNQSPYNPLENSLYNGQNPLSVPPYNSPYSQNLAPFPSDRHHLNYPVTKNGSNFDPNKVSPSLFNSPNY